MKTVLKKVATKLNKHNITWAVGGSFMLSYYNIINNVNDIDLLVAEHDAIKAEHILSTFTEKKTTIGTDPFKTKHFSNYTHQNTSIDLMGGFQISHKNGLYGLDFDQTSITNYLHIDDVRVPLSSLEDWYILYSLIPGRQNKADMIESYWDKYGMRYPCLLTKAMDKPLPDNLVKKLHQLT